MVFGKGEEKKRGAGLRETLLGEKTGRLEKALSMPYVFSWKKKKRKKGPNATAFGTGHKKEREGKRFGAQSYRERSVGFVLDKKKSLDISTPRGRDEKKKEESVLVSPVLSE